MAIVAVIFSVGAPGPVQKQALYGVKFEPLFGAPGFEPRLNPPKGLVLPLHYAPGY